MGASYQVRETELDGFPVRELSSPAGLVATFVPGASMVCCSLRHRGEELLGQRKGLAAFARTGSTMGIPLLHPWANRLGRMGYTLGDTRIEFPPGSPLIHDDGQGLPIHGLLGGRSAWTVREATADDTAARLTAALDVGALPDVMALFPFPHRVRMDVALADATVSIATTVRATGDVAVPMALGYHPYFRLPNVPRADWKVHLPVGRRLRLDARCLPTGETEAVALAPGPLGDRTYDDLFTALAPRPTFILAGGGRRIEVQLGDGYPLAVVYAPASDDVICFEPMTAPTNPFAEPRDLPWVQPGRERTVRFTITVR